MSKTPTVKEFLSSKKWDPQDSLKERYYKSMIEFAKLHVKAALKEASEKATVNINGFIQEYDENCCVDKDSILNAYPLENIK